MKRGPNKGNSLIRNWLSGNRRHEEVVVDGPRDQAGPSSIGRFVGSPPPLTDSSSVTEATTELVTPKTTARPLQLSKHTTLAKVKRPEVPSRIHNDKPAPPKRPSTARKLPPLPRDNKLCLPPARGEPPTRPQSGSQPAKPVSFPKTPRTPPQRHIDLPAVTQRQTALSLPPDSKSMALVVPPRISANEVLRFPSRRTLIYDLTMPPFSIAQLPPPSSSTAVTLFKPGKASSSGSNHKPFPLSRGQLSQFVTTPPTRHIRLVSDQFQIPWTIDIRSRQSTNAFVTVEDFVNEFYFFLQTAVTPAEWDSLPKEFREEVKRARKRRCAAFVAHKIKPKDFHETEVLRRIDFFLDMTMFAGLQRRYQEEVRDTQGNDGASTWLMMLEPRS